MLLLFLLAFFPLVALNAFVVDPWFNTIAEFTLRPSYIYRHSLTMDRTPEYSKSYVLQEHQIGLNLGVRFLPCWEAQVETDVSKVGAQIRYLLSDDVAGDLFSIVLGGQIFYVLKRSMAHGAHSPLGARVNLEVGVSIGKEGADLYQWLHRFYGFLGIGLDGRGHLWVHPFLSQEIKVARRHLFQLFAEGYMMGPGEYFHGADTAHHSSRRHRSLDMGTGYTYLLNIWGTISLKYAHRICARACLRHTHSFRVEYCLPFSPF